MSNLAISKYQLNKLLERAKALNEHTLDPTIDIECYDDNFIQSLLGEDMEGCMAICKEHNLHTAADILNYVARIIFNE